MDLSNITPSDLILLRKLQVIKSRIDLLNRKNVLGNHSQSPNAGGSDNSARLSGSPAQANEGRARSTENGDDRAVSLGDLADGGMHSPATTVVFSHGAAGSPLVLAAGLADGEEGASAFTVTNGGATTSLLTPRFPSETENGAASPKSLTLNPGKEEEEPRSAQKGKTMSGGVQLSQQARDSSPLHSAASATGVSPGSFLQSPRLTENGNVEAKATENLNRKSQASPAATANAAATFSASPKAGSGADSGAYTYDQFCNDLNATDDYIVRLLDLLIKETATGATAPTRQIGTPGFLPTENIDPRAAPQQYHVSPFHHANHASASFSSPSSFQDSAAYVRSRSVAGTSPTNGALDSQVHDDDDYFLCRSPAIISDYPTRSAAFLSDRSPLGPPRSGGNMASGGNFSRLSDIREDADLNAISLDMEQPPSISSSASSSTSPSLSSSLSASPVLTYYPEQQQQPVTSFLQPRAPASILHTSVIDTSPTSARLPPYNSHPVREALMVSTSDIPAFSNGPSAYSFSPYHSTGHADGTGSMGPYAEPAPYVPASLSSSVSSISSTSPISNSSSMQSSTRHAESNGTAGSASNSATSNPWISSNSYEQELIVSRRGSMWDAYDDPSLEGYIVQEINGVQLTDD